MVGQRAIEEQPHLCTLEAVVMSTICVGENSVLILQTPITPRRRVLHGRKRPPQVELRPEWPRDL